MLKSDLIIDTNVTNFAVIKVYRSCDIFFQSLQGINKSALCTEGKLMKPKVKLVA